MENNFPRGKRIHSIFLRAFRFGLVTGILLAILASVWLLVANRMPQYEQYANVRNIIAAILGLIIAVIPVLRFARSPRAVILAGIIAWSCLCLTYFTWTFYFDDLDRVNTIRFFMMGAVVYGLVAALAWIGRALLATRERHQREVDHAQRAHHTLNHS